MRTLHKAALATGSLAIVSYVFYRQAMQELDKCTSEEECTRDKIVWEPRRQYGFYGMVGMGSVTGALLLTGFMAPE